MRRTSGTIPRMGNLFVARLSAVVCFKRNQMMHLSLTYKTNINNFSLCPFLLARSPEYKGKDDARKDAGDVEDGQDVAPEAADYFGRDAHFECS